MFTTFKQGGFFAVIIYMASTYNSVKLSHLKDHPLFNKLPLMTNKGVEDSFKPGFWETQKTGKYTTFYLFSKVNKYFRLHPFSFKYQLKLQNLMTIILTLLHFFKQSSYLHSCCLGTVPNASFSVCKMSHMMACSNSIFIILIEDCKFNIIFFKILSFQFINN